MIVQYNRTINVKNYRSTIDGINFIWLPTIAAANNPMIGLLKRLSAARESIQVYIYIRAVSFHRDKFQVAAKVPSILQK